MIIFAKGKVKDGSIVNAELSAENIYSLCGKCGKEMRIDICEFTQEGCFEPDNSQMYCPECSKSEPWKNSYNLTPPPERDDIIPALDEEG